MIVTVFHGSVLDCGADAVVNAANTELRHGGGVAAAIARAAGPALVAASAAAGFCPLGSAVATTAGRLAARAVIHVPTVDYRAGGRRASADELRAGVRAALRLAREHGCAAVAFPLLGAGIAGWPRVDACRAMAAAFTSAVADGDAPPQVVVCAWSAEDLAAAAEVWPDGGAAEAR